MVDYGWLWLIMVDYGWLWLIMVDYGWLWLITGIVTINANQPINQSGNW